MRHEVTGTSASVAVKIPRIITGPSIIWQLISTGSVQKIQEAVSKGTASIYDVGDDGESLLHVRDPSPSSNLYHLTIKVRC